ncbi:MAG: hypothetical protein AAGH78_05515 [Cyanobacteria bacterium P01_H01_bin.58]
MDNTLSLKFNRLAIAIAMTFLIADICSHPKLASGIVETLSTQIIKVLTSQQLR